jgi:Cys-rich protein (TIGR01571 family)
VGDQKVQWKSSIFPPKPSCFCLKTCICPCWGYGDVVSQMGEGGCVSNCLMFLVCAPCCGGCLIHTSKRGNIRTRYNLVESCADDRLATCCCASCAICQEKFELDERGNSGGTPVAQTMA